LIRAELALSIRVKAMTDIPKDRVIVRAFFLSVPPEIHPPMMMGKRGKMHGARMVRTPPINDIIKRNIRLFD
jgi:hypothetical protein